MLGEFEYEISLAIGLIAIAHFAYRQLDLPINGDEIDGFELLSEFRPKQIASPGAYFEAYFYFVISLTVFYLFICFSEVAFSLVFAVKTAGPESGGSFSPESGSWPLTVALLIIGLSPSFPVLRDIELFFRKLSRNSAGIPQNLIKAYERLREIDFENWQGDEAHANRAEAVSAQYVTDIATKATFICHIANTGFVSSRLGFTAVQSRLMRVLLLYNWTISPDCIILWSSKSVSRLSLIFTERDREDFNALSGKFDEQWEVISSTRLIERLQADGADFTNYDERNNEAYQNLIAELPTEIKDAIDELSAAISALVERLSKLELALCLLHFNDQRKAEIRDTMLRTLGAQLSGHGSEITRNLFAGAILAVAMACLVAALSYNLLHAAFGPESQDWLKAIGDGLSVSGSRMLNAAVMYGAAILGAVLFRMFRKGVGRWDDSGLFGFIQIGRYFGVILAAWFLATLSGYVLWVCHNLIAYPDLRVWPPYALLEEFGELALFIYLPSALVGAIVAAGFVRWLEVLDRNGRRASGVLPLILSSFLIAATCLMVYFFGVLILADDVGQHLVDPTSKISKFLELLIAFIAPLVSLMAVGFLVRSVLSTRQTVQQ